MVMLPSAKVLSTNVCAKVQWEHVGSNLQEFYLRNALLKPIRECFPLRKFPTSQLAKLRWAWPHPQTTWIENSSKNPGIHTVCQYNLLFCYLDEGLEEKEVAKDILKSQYMRKEHFSSQHPNQDLFIYHASRLTYARGKVFANLCFKQG